MDKSKLTLAMLIGIIALNVATVSMSIAWYAKGTTGTVDAINISFDGERDLKISTKVDGDYVDHLNYSDLTPANKFMPVTSAHSSIWMSEKRNNPVFYDDTKVFAFAGGSYTPEKVEDGYYSQELFLLADDDLYITIDPSKTFISPNEIYNNQNADRLYEEYQKSADPSKMKSKEEILEGLNKIHQAMRFSILIANEETYDYKIIDPNYDNQDTLLAGVLDNDIDHYYDYYQNPEDLKIYERFYGEYSGNIIYNEASSTDSEYEDVTSSPSAFNAKHKAGVRSVNLQESINNGLEIKKEEILKLDDFQLGNAKYHFPIRAYKPTRVVVSIYIEGWDKASINSTMGATFNAGLGFKIESELV